MRHPSEKSAGRKGQNPQRKRLKQVFLRLIEKVDTSKIFLNKIMFYVDFWHYTKFHKSITGTNYIPLQYGPCPEHYHEILKEMIDGSLISCEADHCFKVNLSPDLRGFTQDEIQTIDEIIALAQTDRGKKLFDLSHQEKGFLETPLYQPISYEIYARDLKIENLIRKGK